MRIAKTPNVRGKVTEEVSPGAEGAVILNQAMIVKNKPEAERHGIGKGRHSGHTHEWQGADPAGIVFAGLWTCGPQIDAHVGGLRITQSSEAEETNFATTTHRACHRPRRCRRVDTGKRVGDERGARVCASTLSPTYLFPPPSSIGIVSKKKRGHEPLMGSWPQA